MAQVTEGACQKGVEGVETLQAGVRDISSPSIWVTIWRRSHGRQKCRPNGLINYLVYLMRLAYLLYGLVASLSSPSSNIEGFPDVSAKDVPAKTWRPTFWQKILLSPKWAEFFVAQMAGDETSLPRKLQGLLAVSVTVP